MADLRAWDLVKNGFRKVTRATLGDHNPLTVTMPDATGKILGESGYTGPVVQIEELPNIEIDLTPNTINGGIKTITTAGTAEQLTATSSTGQYILLQPLSTNTGLVYVGGTDVDKDTKNGIVLTVPADSAGVKVPTMIPLPITDPSLVYIDVTVNGEGVHWIQLGKTDP